MRTVLGLLVFMIGGCVSPLYDQPTREALRVQVTQNADQVKGAKLLNTCSVTLGALTQKNELAMNLARNFTHQNGGNIAYVQFQPMPAGQYGSGLHVAIEAYRKD